MSLKTLSGSGLKYLYIIYRCRVFKPFKKQALCFFFSLTSALEVFSLTSALEVHFRGRAWPLDFGLGMCNFEMNFGPGIDCFLELIPNVSRPNN